MGVMPAPTSAASTSASPAEPDGRSGAPHLRSTSEVEGYRIRGMDGQIGHLEDLVVDDEAWVIRYVVVGTSNWLPGKKVLISARWISGIRWADAEVHADLGGIEIKEAPAWHPDRPGLRDEAPQLLRASPVLGLRSVRV